MRAVPDITYVHEKEDFRNLLESSPALGIALAKRYTLGDGVNDPDIMSEWYCHCGANLKVRRGSFSAVCFGNPKRGRWWAGGKSFGQISLDQRSAVVPSLFGGSVCRRLEIADIVESKATLQTMLLHVTMDVIR